MTATLADLCQCSSPHTVSAWHALTNFIVKLSMKMTRPVHCFFSDPGSCAFTDSPTWLAIAQYAASVALLFFSLGLCMRNSAPVTGDAKEALLVMPCALFLADPVSVVTQLLKNAQRLTRHSRENKANVLAVLVLMHLLSVARSTFCLAHVAFSPIANMRSHADFVGPALVHACIWRLLSSYFQIVRMSQSGLYTLSKRE